MPVLPVEQRVTSRQTSKYKRFPSRKARKTEKSGARSKSLASLRALESVLYLGTQMVRSDRRSIEEIWRTGDR